MKTDVSEAMSLVSRVHTESVEFLTARLSEQGLPNFATSHGFILFQLAKCGALSMGELAARVNRDKSTLTVLVQKLLREDFVEMRKSENDGRSRIIALTEKGRAYNEVTARLSSELLETFFKGFSKEEKERLCEFLLRIKNNFNSPSHE